MEEKRYPCSCPKCGRTFTLAEKEWKACFGKEKDHPACYIGIRAGMVVTATGSFEHFLWRMGLKS